MCMIMNGSDGLGGSCRGGGGSGGGGGGGCRVGEMIYLYLSIY